MKTKKLLQLIATEIALLRRNVELLSRPSKTLPQQLAEIVGEDKAWQELSKTMQQCSEESKKLVVQLGVDSEQLIKDKIYRKIEKRIDKLLQDNEIKTIDLAMSLGESFISGESKFLYARIGNMTSEETLEVIDETVNSSSKFQFTDDWLIVRKEEVVTNES